ncbi:translation initiation factor IF-3, partial [Cellulomonas sp.]|uniref:translation initiation factor IF-3 n=1 Tax=Cellulomonas sp. TaxID=40001 RepID=UPI0025C07D30
MLRTGAFLVPGGRSRRTRGATISEPRINDRIRVAEVRLVGPNGEQVGIVRVEDALRLAQDADLDLVEVAPDARPPVCKIMDYGKFKYEADMKAREARRNQTNTVLKEIRFRLKIDPHDYGTKKGHVTRFLAAGDKVKVMIMFRGREQSRPEMGIRLLQRLADDVADLGFVESAPKQDGRNMIMVLGPVKKKADQKQEQRRQAQADAARAANAAAAAAAAAPAPADAPAAETPAVETPAAVEAPVVETPAAVEAPAAQAPAAETPAVETPAAETPAAEPTPARPAAPRPAAPRPAA